MYFYINFYLKNILCFHHWVFWQPLKFCLHLIQGLETNEEEPFPKLEEHPMWSFKRGGRKVARHLGQVPTVGMPALAGSWKGLDTHFHGSSVRWCVSVSEKFNKLPQVKQLASGETGIESDFSLHCKAPDNGLFRREHGGMNRVSIWVLKFHFMAFKYRENPKYTISVSGVNST